MNANSLRFIAWKLGVSFDDLLAAFIAGTLAGIGIAALLHVLRALTPAQSAIVGLLGGAVVAVLLWFEALRVRAMRERDAADRASNVDQLGVQMMRALRIDHLPVASMRLYVQAGRPPELTLTLITEGEIGQRLFKVFDGFRAEPVADQSKEN